MGMDLYAGTLTRYYAHNWKTAAQQWAEEHGMGFSRVGPNGEPLTEEKADPAEVRAGMESWRDQVLSAITQPGTEPYKPWTEDNERPYYTEKPDWDAFGAMLLVAACHVYGEPVPETVEKGWDYIAHPLIRRMGEDPAQGWSLLRGAEWWLPIEDTFLFQAPCLNGAQIIMATAGLLRWELEKLNKLAWQADEAAILEWSRTEGYPMDGQIDGAGRLAMGETHQVYNTQSLAKFAFSIFWQALNFAQENRVPILLDY